MRLGNHTLRVEADSKTLLRVPIHHIGSLVCFGRVTVSRSAMARCAADQRDIVFLSRGGRFRAKVVGPTSGNVLLRLAQFRAHEDEGRTLEIARNIVAAKVQNGRLTLMREVRQTSDEYDKTALRDASKSMADRLALTLINRRQLTSSHFDKGWGEACRSMTMDEK